MASDAEDDFEYRPTAGVQTDFNNLLTAFENTGTIRYESFSQLWNSMKLNTIYYGRQSERECREVSCG